MFTIVHSCIFILQLNSCSQQDRRGRLWDISVPLCLYLHLISLSDGLRQARAGEASKPLRWWVLKHIDIGKISSILVGDRVPCIMKRSRGYDVDKPRRLTRPYYMHQARFDRIVDITMVWEREQGKRR